MPNETYTPDQMATAIAEIGVAVLQTKTTTQNGTVTPDAGYDGLSSVTVNVSGNPNYVETIEGTLANPWGDYTASELFSEASNYSITLFITAELVYSDGGNAETTTMSYIKADGSTTFGFTRPGISATTIQFSRAGYSSAGTLVKCVAGNINTSAGTQELLVVPGETPCTLTIIHHPLPSGS